MRAEGGAEGQFWLRFWGVRGSHPTPGRSTVRVGGNSVCVELYAGGQRLIFDAGTGLIRLGEDLCRNAHERQVDLFLSHYHHDHIDGLRFFAPLYERGWTCRIHGPKLGSAKPAPTLRQAMAPAFFPVQLEELPARLEIREVRDDAIVRPGGRGGPRVRVRLSQAHPKLGVALYRVEYAAKTLVYVTDLEAVGPAFDEVVDFARGGSVLVHDAQYTEEEYFSTHRSRAGWGHSTVRMAAEVARAAGVGKLFLYHHDPSHDDRFLLSLLREARSLFRLTELAREGLRVDLTASPL